MRNRFLALVLIALLVMPAGGLAEGYSGQKEFSYLYSIEITTMNYLKTSTTVNMKASPNFVDTLVSYDQYGLLVPALATEWSVSDDGLVWTFKLREDQKWFDCNGKEVANVTANDFVDALVYLLTLSNESTTADLVTPIIKNASGFYSGVITDPAELGVKAIDDYTLEYTLQQPCPYFLSMLTYVCFFPAYGPFLAEMGENFGTTRDTILYCGPYVCSSWEPQVEFVWEKNPGYWDADKVYIETIYGRYNAEADSLAPEMFLRGEVDTATITTAILDEWLQRADTKDAVHPTRPTAGVMMLLLNFAPDFSSDGFDTENYKLAVNNRNFRLSIASGVDKYKAVSAYDPDNPTASIANTIVPEGFAINDGKDYTDYGDLAMLKNGMYDAEKAIEYRDAAIAELTEQGVKFPIVIPYYFNPSEHNMADCNQVVEQQLEALLGTDYIDIVVMSGPSTDYIATVRRPGKWGLFEAGWSPDYADPATYADPFDLGWTFGSAEKALDPSFNTGYIYTQEDFDAGIVGDEEYIGTEQKMYNKLVQDARLETLDIDKRYEMFAAAEAYLMEEGFVIPLRWIGAGYTVSKLDPFDGSYSPFGIAMYSYKGRHILEKSMSMAEYQAALEAWEIAREQAMLEASND